MKLGNSWPGGFREEAVLKCGRMVTNGGRTTELIL